MRKDKFLNPYNFIGFPPKKEEPYKNDETTRHTGVIHYTVTTKSPLFIPNSSTDEAFRQSKEVEGHKSYDFFSYTELSKYTDEQGNPEAPIPVIPGSEMRGVMRSVYETLTDSCMGVLNSDTLPIKRNAYRFNSGLIRKDKDGLYKLIKANSFRIGDKAEEGELPPGFEEYSNGTLIYYNRSKNGTVIKNFQKDKKNGYTYKGYLIKWGMGIQEKEKKEEERRKEKKEKSRYHLFTPQKKDGKEQLVEEIEGLSKDVLEIKLISVIDSYINQISDKDDSENTNINIKAYNEYKDDLKKFMRSSSEKTSYFPVNYSILSNGMFHLSPAVFTKEISNNSIEELAGKFAPCSGVEECPACELFGHVSEGNDTSRGSKIRFSDLYVTDEGENKDYYYNLITLPALSSPKLGNVEFYLKKPQNATFWTYDYHVKNGNLIIKPGQLRGRKYYWHHPGKNILDKIPHDISPGNLNKTVRPLREDVTFSGELYFENISEKQLRQLIWICNCGSVKGADESVEKLGYKLGAAKPFGFGSVVCEVTEVEERTIESQNGKISYNISADIKERYICSYEAAGFSSHCKKQFYRIAGLNSVTKGTDITYPKTFKQMNEAVIDEGFRWYVENRKTVSGENMPKGREDVRICATLPALDEEDVCLPYRISKNKKA